MISKKLLHIGTLLHKKRTSPGEKCVEKVDSEVDDVIFM